MKKALVKYFQLIIFLSLLGFTSCNSIAQGFQSSLENMEEFQALQREPLSAKYGEAQAVKLVYELESETIFYISNEYDYHNKFCIEVLGYEKSLHLFNLENYGANLSSRKYLLANINYFSSSDLYFLELSPSDEMPIEQIQFLHKTVIESSYLDKDLPLILNSVRLQNLFENGEIDIPTITPQEIYENQTFQAVSQFERVGFLKKFSMEQLDTANLTPSDIVLINGTPLQLPAVSGAITTELQTPLSHLSILGQNRQVPVMALKSSWEDEEINSLVGKWVLFSVTSEGYSIEETEKPEPPKEPKKRKSLKFDLSVEELVEVTEFDRKTSNYCGYKAENFGVLNELSEKFDFKVPESGFGIPFYFYHEHLKSSGAQRLINKLFFTENKEALLLEIQKTILEAPVDQSLLDSIETKILTLGNFERMRFRSSTNAEDMKGFSGAGLYTSKTGEIGSDKKPIDQALKAVWASLWNKAAYLEREYFNLKHEECYMGILVHRSFPNEAVNGVAITKNIYRDNNLGFVVNAQLGEESVVQPNPEITCDQIVCYPSEKTGFYSTNQTVEIITTSSLNDHKLVMTKEEILHLANVLNEIKKHFYYRDFTTKTYYEYGLDLEFKLDGETRELYIKQVRPYNY